MSCFSYYGSGNYKPHKVDIIQLNIIKCRRDWKCRKCKCDIPINSFCLNSSFYRKTCLKCATEFYDNAEKSVKEFLKLIKLRKKSFHEDKIEMIEKNTIAKI